MVEEAINTKVSSIAKVLAVPEFLSSEVPENFKSLKAGDLVTITDQFPDQILNLEWLKMMSSVDGMKEKDLEVDFEKQSGIPKFIGVMADWQRKYGFTTDKIIGEKENEFLFLVPYAALKTSVTADWCLRYINEK